MSRCLLGGPSPIGYVVSSSSSKLALSQVGALDPFPLIVVLVDAEIWELSRHYPTWRTTFDDGVFREVFHAEISAEEVFVEVKEPVDG